MPCTERWTKTHLDLCWEDYPGRVVRFDRKAGFALARRLENAHEAVSVEALLLGDVEDLIRDVYADVRKMEIPMHYEMRPHQMDGHISMLENVLGCHQFLFGKHKYRCLESYHRFVWKCYKTWDRTQKKWSRYPQFLAWVAAEFRSKVGRDIIRHGRNGNAPNGHYNKWTQSGRCSLPDAFDFGDYVKREEDQEPKPRGPRQLRLKFPREVACVED